MPTTPTRLAACTCALALALAVAACGDDDSLAEQEAAVDSDTAFATFTAPPSTVPAQPLEGPTWTLTDAPALDVSIEGVTVTAHFVDGNVTGTGGCNQYSGLYQLQGSLLSIAPEIVSTRRACDTPVDEVETAYLEALPDVGSFTIEGGALTLVGLEGVTLLEYETTDAGAALVGDWTVTSYYNGNAAITSVLLGTELTASFADDQVSGDGGCNTFSGPYTVDGDGIEIGPLASTLRSCGDEELDLQEQQYLAALQLAESFMVTGDRLDLFRAGGPIAVTFERG